MDLEPHVAFLWCPTKYVVFLNLEQNVDLEKGTVGPSVGWEFSGMADSPADKFGFNKTSFGAGVEVAFGEVWQFNICLHWSYPLHPCPLLSMSTLKANKASSSKIPVLMWHVTCLWQLFQLKQECGGHGFVSPLNRRGTYPLPRVCRRCWLEIVVSNLPCVGISSSRLTFAQVNVWG